MYVSSVQLWRWRKLIKQLWFWWFYFSDVYLSKVSNKNWRASLTARCCHTLMSKYTIGKKIVLFSCSFRDLTESIVGQNNHPRKMERKRGWIDASGSKYMGAGRCVMEERSQQSVSLSRHPSLKSIISYGKKSDPRLAKRITFHSRLIYYIGPLYTTMYGNLP